MLTSQAPQTPSPSTLMGIPFYPLSTKEALKHIRVRLGRRQQSLFFVNAHCMNIACTDLAYRDVLQQASLVFPDGVGIELASKLTGQPWQDNLNGTDLFPLLCALCERQNHSVFLLGAQPGTAEKVCQWIRRQFPKLKVAGVHHGHFSDEDSPSVINAINHSQAEVLIVAMGVPRQELWIAQYQAQLHPRLHIAVGGLFEFYSNNIPRAPALLRRYRLEWMWRLMQEPKRLWRRYLLGSVLFALRVLAEAWQHHRQKRVALTRFTASALRLQSWRMAYLHQRFHICLWWRACSKRSFDIVVASSLLLMLAPLFPFVALLIKLDSPGPVFFTQIRAGENGHPFTLLKLRTMSQDAEQRLAQLQHLNEKKGGIMFKIQNDPRVTRLGRFLRRHSIDELPQLWNVLCGDMSIVGPRPALFNEVAQYCLQQRTRLKLQPGLTSEWVVAGRNALTFEQQAALDIHYYFHRSVWYDMKLLLRTIPAVLFARGAS